MLTLKLFGMVGTDVKTDLLALIIYVYYAQVVKISAL